MRTPRSFLVFAALGLASTVGGAARAEPSGRAPAGGGLAGVEATFDLAAGVLKTRVEGAAWKSLAIPIDRSRLDAKGATVEAIPIGEGKHVLRARVVDAQRKDLAFEAILAGKEGEPIFAGLTGAARGEDGERYGQTVRVYDRDASSKFVVVGDVREDTRICGQLETPLQPRGLDARTLQLRGATLHRLDKAVRDGATRVVAQPRAAEARAPLAQLLQASSGSAGGATALTDGKLETTWSEARPGDGHGEFATMRAPTELALHTIVVTVAPSTGARAEGAAPRTFYLATDRELFHVTMPHDAWTKPGAAYDVPLPKPLATSCVSVVLDEAYDRGLAAPEVTLTEVAALGKFDADGATLDDVAKELAGPRGEEAAALLKRSGEPGLAAVAKRWGALDAAGRAFGVDIASTGSCGGAAAELLTRALADADREVRKRALGRLERCGKDAAPALASAVRSEDEPRRAAAAPLLAAIAPSLAVDPVGEMLGKGSAATRRSLRSALSRAASSAPRDKLAALLAKKDAGRLDVVRALGKKLPELRPESAGAIGELLAASPDMATRWLLAQPLAELGGRSGADEQRRLADLIKSDPDAPVRARAVEVSAEIPELAPAIVAAAGDREPRVREAALRAIASAHIASGAPAATKALAKDDWTFVRVAAAEAAGAVGADDAEAALAEALGDASPKVRVAAVAALGARRATRRIDAIRARLDDTKEDVEVRALAARTLGKLCAKNAIDRLTKLALAARSPTDENDDRLGMAAIDALAALHPADLEQRLAPLRTKDIRLPLKRAADRALAEPASCGR